MSEADRPERLTPEPLVYGEIDDGLVFLPARRAHALVRLRESLANARTWGELRALLDEELWAEVQERRDVYDVVRSGGRDDAEFDPRLLAGYAEGAWPRWPANEMIDLLPTDLVQRYGKLTDTLLDGPFLCLYAQCEEELVGDLVERGWECERDDQLVLEASGYD